MGFSPNLILDFQQIWYWSFMQHAYEAGTLVAFTAGIVGYFVVLRRTAFAAHALSHIGFAGAAGAVLFGADPVFGLLLFTSAGGVTMTVLGPRASNRDAQIGIVLAFMLGLGVLFISLYKGYANQAYSILFGEILGISLGDVELTLLSTLLIIGVIAFVYRPLLFSSLDGDVAESKGIPTASLGVVFMILLAVAVSFAVQVVGVLLIFSLMVTPAATAQHLAKRPHRAMIVSVAIALGATWTGLFVAYYVSYPVSFFITTISFSIYVLVRLFHHRIQSPGESRKAGWRRRPAV